MIDVYMYNGCITFLRFSLRSYLKVYMLRRGEGSGGRGTSVKRIPEQDVNHFLILFLRKY